VAGTATNPGETAVTFPIPLASAPSVVLWNGTGSPPAGCGGTATEPTAEPGKLCIFSTQNQVGGSFNSYIPGDIGRGGEASRLGFGYVFTPTSDTGPWDASGTYAVTAP
jgi:hypothetical protein